MTKGRERKEGWEIKKGKRMGRKKLGETKRKVNQREEKIKGKNEEAL